MDVDTRESRSLVGGRGSLFAFSSEICLAVGRGLGTVAGKRRLKRPENESPYRAEFAESDEIWERIFGFLVSDLIDKRRDLGKLSRITAALIWVERETRDWD
ncbi:acetyl-coenzyme A carboxylase carboxyltransferase subunit beta [Striga asiatica]|uniref:Acetyl-coenzyme A carboxylase carboxyltransferase subunit beta n=1 Tax=Striga asiatica TaxID=4170 RepID=A0A5A7QBY2_STRAF|nr:acetyl-coenzyme A carboxylase carboxyltransferase subunit beta [Striga asiatica]